MSALALRPRTPAWLAPVAVGAGALASCAIVATVDPNQAGRYPTCPFLALTGLPCPGCGALRAVHALTRADVVAAAGSNLLVVLVLPVLAWVWVGWLRARLGQRPAVPLPPPAVTAALPLVVVTFWVLRLIPAAPFAALAP